MADNKRLWAIGTAPDQGSEQGGETLEGGPPADEALLIEEANAVESWEPAEEYTDEDEAQPQQPRFGWLLPALAVLAVLAWSGFFAWAHRETVIAGAAPAQWSQLIVDWSVPVLLVVALWLLAMRNSRREAARFGFAAQALAVESQNLEHRLSTVNRELSLARDFIAAQSRDLELLGRVAAERLSQNADRLQGLIRDNGEQVEQIGRVSGTALANMDRLRSDLPVISNSARDMTSQIGQAGEVARQQLDHLHGGFERLTTIGEASGHQVDALHGKVNQAMAAFETQATSLEEVLGRRFVALAERSAAFRAELDGREVEAFAAMRRRADTLGQEMAVTAEQIALQEHEALAALAERMAHASSEAANLTARLREGEIEAGERWAGAIAELEDRLRQAIVRVTEVDERAMENARGRLAALRDEAARVDDTIAERLAAFEHQRELREAEAAQREAAVMAALGERLAEFDTERQQRQLAAGERDAAALVALGERLSQFELQRERTQAAAGESARAALAELEERLAGFEEQRQRRALEVGDREAAALAALEQRIAGFDTQRARLEAEAGERETAALASLEQRLATFEDQHRQRATAVDAREAAALAELERRIAEFDAQRQRREAEARELQAVALAELEQHFTAFDEERERRSLVAGESLSATLADLRQRLGTFDSEWKRRDSEEGRRQTAALADLEQRLAAFDAQVNERQQEQLAHVAGLAERSEALAARLGELSAAMDDLVLQGHETQGDLTQATAGFAARVADSRDILAQSGANVARLTEDSVRLLELIRASADHTATDLPRAVGVAEARLASFENQSRVLSAVIEEAAERGATLATHVAAARGDGVAAMDELAGLEARLREVAAQTDALARSARDELAGSIATLQEAAGGALGNLQENQAAAIREIAERIGADSSAAIADALRANAVQAVAELEDAARQAGEAGRQTAVQLRDQLARVNELAGNLEQRVAYARERAEEQVDNDFARRMALITESLNSNAIDISKAFANEVTDTAWTSYLRGDRGIFTRRAVRLLDNHEARAVCGIYEGDGDFRETVNRYIHDFEAMLRTVLSTRDGHALAVTLLSSDMGKLYVALAQAIDRLR